MKTVIASVLFSLFLSSTSFALDCKKECMNSDDPAAKCIPFSTPLRFSVKALVDMINAFAEPNIPNVAYSSCPRKINVNPVGSVISQGAACTEWSVRGFDDPSLPNDHLNGEYGAVKLPQVLHGQFSSSTGELTFDPRTGLPHFKFQIDGKIRFAGDVSSIGTILDSKKLVLSTAQMCYSVRVQ